MTTSAELSESIEDVIRLPSELPSGWEKSSLADVAEIIMGQSPSSEYYNTEGSGLPFFQGKAEFGDLHPEAVKWCSAPGKIAQKDDVLISVRAPVGPTNLAPSECCIGRGLAAIRPRNGIPPKYILHYLRSIESDIDSLGTGTTFKAISGKTLREIPIPVAPPDQQKRIVAEIEKQFSRLDEAVANLKRVKANLKRYKAAVLKAAVEGRLVETEAELARREGRSFETGAQLLQRILETRRSQWKGKGKYKEPAAPTTDLPELPEGWVWASIGQLCFLDSGEAFKKADYSSDGLRLLQIANVGFAKVEWSQRNYLPSSFGEKFPELLMQDGDIVLALNRPIIGGRLKVASVSKKDLPAILYQRVGRLRPTTGGSPAYLFYFFQSPHMLAGVRARLQGTDQPYLNTSLVPDITVPFPPLAEQRRLVTEIDRRLSIADESEVQVETNLQRAERLRSAVLNKSFSNGI